MVSARHHHGSKAFLSKSKVYLFNLYSTKRVQRHRKINVFLVATRGRYDYK